MERKGKISQKFLTVIFLYYLRNCRYNKGAVGKYFQEVFYGFEERLLSPSSASPLLGVASVCTIESAKGGVLRNACRRWHVSYTLTLDSSATFASNAATINTTEGNPIVFTSS
jgi:hypothetical protein